MGEVFPVVAGAIIGMIASRIAALRLRWIVAGLLTLAAGFGATFFSGEAEESWAFVLVDIGIVAIVAAIVWGIATYVARRLNATR